MIRPNRENMSSTSFWVMVRGSPLMYRLASLMTSELGRAYDTLKIKPLSAVRAGVRPKHRGVGLTFQARKSHPSGEKPCQHSLPAAVRASSSPGPSSEPDGHPLAFSRLDFTLHGEADVFQVLKAKRLRAHSWQQTGPPLNPAVSPTVAAPSLTVSSLGTGPSAACEEPSKGSGSRAGRHRKGATHLPAGQLATGAQRRLRAAGGACSPTLECSILNDSMGLCFGSLFCKTEESLQGTSAAASIKWSVCALEWGGFRGQRPGRPFMLSQVRATTVAGQEEGWD